MPETVTAEQKEDPGYRTWMYNKIDGEIISQVVDAVEAERLFEFGWRMSPAEFSDNEDLVNSPHFHSMASDMANIMNLLLNIDVCEDRMILKDIATNYLKLDFKPNTPTASLKKKIKQKAKELEILPPAKEE